MKFLFNEFTDILNQSLLTLILFYFYIFLKKKLHKKNIVTFYVYTQIHSRRNWAKYYWIPVWRFQFWLSFSHSPHIWLVVCKNLQHNFILPFDMLLSLLLNASSMFYIGKVYVGLCFSLSLVSYVSLRVV
jgi:hypothetical protein